MGCCNETKDESKVSASDSESKEWPFWARLFVPFRKASDKGVGDVIARVIGSTNSARYKKWHLEIFHQECGCEGIQEQMNKDFPF